VLNIDFVLWAPCKYCRETEGAVNREILKNAELDCSFMNAPCGTDT